MSQPYDAAEAELIKEATEDQIGNYVFLTVATLLPIYEFVITFDQEVAAVWLRDKKLSLVSILLVSTRWCMFLSAMTGSLPAFTNPGCKGLTVFFECLVIAGFAQVAVFSALRASALWGRNRAIFFVVVVLGFVPVVTNSFVVASSRYFYSSDFGACLDIIEIPDHVFGALTIAARIPVIIADALVLILTWAKTYKQVMAARRAQTTTSVSLCLLRDGTIYFVILLTLNLLELLTHRTSTSSIVSSFITGIPPILVNRFMLNLRQVDAKNDTQTAGGVSNFSAPQFRIADSIFGNFSEPLEHGASLISEDEGPGRFNSVSEDISRDENSAQWDNEASTGSVGCVVEADQMRRVHA